MSNQYHNYREWEAEATRRGGVIEPSGDGKLAAHIDGYQFGVWDPKYGGAGYGYFWSINSMIAGIDPQTIQVIKWPDL